MADKYGDGTVRITCEENVLFVNVPDAKLPAMLEEPLFKRFKVNPGPLLAGLVSCTGERGGGGCLGGSKLVAASGPRPVRAPTLARPRWWGQGQCGLRLPLGPIQYAARHVGEQTHMKVQGAAVLCSFRSPHAPVASGSAAVRAIQERKLPYSRS